LRSPDGRALGWLLRKEWRELLVSPAWWLLLGAMGPLTGLSFISAMRTYAELSAANGTAGGVGEALAPLAGVWAPAFSACELAAVFLLPFVAIRIAGADRRSGALKLELQQGRVSPLARMAAKAMVAMAGWLIAMVPAFSTLVLWKIYGGSLCAPEMATLAAGHMLNAALTIALGAAAASIAAHPSTAAMITLGVTVGTWIVSFVAAVQGGIWERVAAFTPSAMVGDFQHGLLRLDEVLIGGVLVMAGLGLAATWQRIGVRMGRRMAESAALLGVAALAILGCSTVRASWDTSESRANSFPKADEQALAQIRGPLKMRVHLAPEDPRRVDLEHRVLSRLRRVMPNLEIEYQSATSIGLFEQTANGYGELVYSLQGRSATSRATTPEAVLETIYELASVTAPADVTEVAFRGHPLAAAPTGAAPIFYGLWPGATLACFWWVRRRFL
jgi:ABC-2 type transport system permease protein